MNLLSLVKITPQTKNEQLRTVPNTHKEKNMKKHLNPCRTLLATALAGTLALCSASPMAAAPADSLAEQAESVEAALAESTAESLAEQPKSGDTSLMDWLASWLEDTPKEPTPGEKIASGKISTVFIGEPFYDDKISNEDDALAAIYSVMDRLGGDENIELLFHDSYENDEDTVFYCFEQSLGGIEVDNGNVKIVVDKDGNAVGLISTLICGLEHDPDYVWEITQEEAEAIVSEKCKETGAKVISSSTEATVLWDENAKTMIYVWVVYTTNPSHRDERAYLAHYVTGIGDYLYELPVMEPGDAEALSGAPAIFAFEGYEAGEWTGVVKDIDGPERTITVPVMIDKETGKSILGDPKRKILCADYSSFAYHETLSPVESSDNNFINNELITYEMFIRIWDFYDNLGWHGPDAEGTPTLLLLNMVDEDGEPVDNAAYIGEQRGFQAFEINDAFGDGSCSDIIGHEFTHCVTGKSMSGNKYENDFGAINESISDIMGNLIEMSFGDSPGGEWIFSERHGNGAIRNMKEPHVFKQPAFVWDEYYVPHVVTPGDFTDRGGVHINSSILSYIAYQLAQAGMPLEDQIYYWFNVDLSLTPTTDYPLLAEILPWCLDLTGYSEYKEAMEKAIEYADLTREEAPEKAKDDQALATLTLPFDPEELGVDVRLIVMELEKGGQFRTWPFENGTNVAIVIPEGDYLLQLQARTRGEEPSIAYYLLTPEGWVEKDKGLYEVYESEPADRLAECGVHFGVGEVTELMTEGL